MEACSPTVSCGLVVRLRKSQGVLVLPRMKFVDEKLSFEELFEDIYEGDSDVRVACRVGFKKPGDAEPKDSVSVDLAESVGTIVKALGAKKKSKTGSLFMGTGYVPVFVPVTKYSLIRPSFPSMQC